MFVEIPNILSTILNAREQFLQVLHDPPADAFTLRLFLDFRELRALFASLSTMQILHISNNLLPPGESLVLNWFVVGM